MTVDLSIEPSRADVVNVALMIAVQRGCHAISARSVAAALGCSATKVHKLLAVEEVVALVWEQAMNQVYDWSQSWWAGHRTKGKVPTVWEGARFVVALCQRTERVLSQMGAPENRLGVELAASAGTAMWAGLVANALRLEGENGGPGRGLLALVLGMRRWSTISPRDRAAAVDSFVLGTLQVEFDRALLPEEELALTLMARVTARSPDVQVYPGPATVHGSAVWIRDAVVMRLHGRGLVEFCGVEEVEKGLATKPGVVLTSAGAEAASLVPTSTELLESLEQARTEAAG